MQQPTPSWMSNDFSLESDVFVAPAPDSPHSLVACSQPTKSRKVDMSVDSAAALQGARDDPVSLADLARKVLVLNNLPYESRASAMAAWLQTARGLGDEQYNECVQLAVSLLTRRNAGKKAEQSINASKRPSLASVLGDIAAPLAPPCSQSHCALRQRSTPAPAMPMLTLRDLEADRSMPRCQPLGNDSATFASMFAPTPRGGAPQQLDFGLDFSDSGALADLEARLFPRKESDSLAALQDLFADEPQGGMDNMFVSTRGGACHPLRSMEAAPLGSFLDELNNLSAVLSANKSSRDISSSPSSILAFFAFSSATDMQFLRHRAGSNNSSRLSMLPGLPYSILCNKRRLLVYHDSSGVFAACLYLSLSGVDVNDSFFGFFTPVSKDQQQLTR